MKNILAFASIVFICIASGGCDDQLIERFPGMHRPGAGVSVDNHVPPGGGRNPGMVPDGQVEAQLGDPDWTCEKAGPLQRTTCYTFATNDPDYCNKNFPKCHHF